MLLNSHAALISILPAAAPGYFWLGGRARWVVRRLGVAAFEQQLRAQILAQRPPPARAVQ